LIIKNAGAPVVCMLAAAGLEKDKKYQLALASERRAA